MANKPTKVAQKKKELSKRDKAKKLVKENWKPFAVGVGVTVITVTGVIILRRVVFPNQTAQLLKKLVIKDSVLLIQSYEHRQGPPSFMVRVDDGRLFRSQEAAARALGTDPSTISRYFNGHRNHVNGHQLERVAMEIGRNG